MKKIALAILILISYVGAVPTYIYRSIGPSKTSYVDTGSSTKTLTISGTTATFGTAVADTVGVGDVICYDTASNGTLDTLCFISGRTSSTVFTVNSRNGGTPKSRTTISSWGIYRAYTSISLAVASTENIGIPTPFKDFDVGIIQSNLVSLNEERNYCLYADAADTSSYININGTDLNFTDSLRFFHFYVPCCSTEVGRTQKHSGKWSDSRARIVPTVKNPGVLYFTNTRYFKFEGFQIKPDSGMCITMGTTNHWVIARNIIDGQNKADVAGIYYWYSGVIYRNIIYGCNLDFYGALRLASKEDSDSVKVINNTFYGNNLGIRSGNAGVVLKNNLCIKNGSTNKDYYAEGTYSTQSDYNADGDSSAQANVGGTHNFLKLLPTIFTDTSSSVKDYHIKNTSILYRAGFSYPSDPKYPTVMFNVDIDNDTVRSNWDIGADQSANVNVKHWRGGAPSDSSNYNNRLNYKEGEVPIAGDSLLFDSLNIGSAKACSINVATAALKSIKSLVAYTGKIVVKSGAKVITTNDQSYNHAGALFVYDSMIITGDGTYNVGANVTSVTKGRSCIDLRGTGNLQLDWLYTPIFTLKCSYAGKTTTVNGNMADNAVTCNRIVFGTGTFTVNKEIDIAPDTTDWMINGGVSINGSSIFLIKAMTSATLNMPALNCNCSGGFRLHNYNATTNCVVTQTGDIVASAGIFIYGANASVSLTYNVGANNLRTAGPYYFGNSAGSSNNFTLNMGSGTSDTCGSFVTENTVASTYNMQSSQIVCGGNWAFGNKMVVDRGTSKLSFTANANLTALGNQLYDINIIGGTLTNIGNLSCHTLSSAGTAGFNSGAYTVKVEAGINLIGTGTKWFLDSLTITGDGNFITAGTWACSTSTFTHKGTGILTPPSGAVWKDIHIGYAGKVDSVKTSGFAIKYGTLYFEGGQTTINAATILSGATPYVVNGSSVINGTANITVASTNIAIAGLVYTYTLNAITYTGTGKFSLSGAQGTNVYNVAGNISWGVGKGAHMMVYLSSSVSDSVLFNLSSYTVNADTIEMGSKQAAKKFIANFGTGNIITNCFKDSSSTGGGTTPGNLTVGTVIFNKVSSKWFLAGNFYENRVASVDAGTSELHFVNKTGTASIRSTGRVFFDIYQDSTGGTLKLLDSLTANSFTQFSGSFDQNYKTIRTTDDFQLNGAGVDSINSWVITSGDAVIFRLNNSNTIAVKCSINTAGSSSIYLNRKYVLGRWVFGDGKIYGYQAGDSVTISTNVSGDISGTSTATKLASLSSGSRFYVGLPAGMKLTYFDVKDCFNYGTLCTANAVSDTSRGNNYGFVFLNTDIDSIYRNAGTKITCLSGDTNKTVYYDSLQRDSVTAYKDTTSKVALYHEDSTKYVYPSYSYKLITHYRDTVIDSTCLNLDTLRVIRKDTLQTDSIKITKSGCTGDTTHKDTTYNWKHTINVIDTSIYLPTIDTLSVISKNCPTAFDLISRIHSACSGHAITYQDTFYFAPACPTGTGEIITTPFIPSQFSDSGRDGFRQSAFKNSSGFDSDIWGE